MTKTREYIQEKNIETLFEELMRLVINEKPENPISFLISSLQEKGETLLFRKPTICSNGPSVRERRNLKCDGQALNIRKSLERVLPKSCDPKPSASVEKVRHSKSATPLKKSTKPATKVVRIPSGQATGENGPEVAEKTLGAEDVVVSQEYVQGVQSIFNFGRKKKKKSVGNESDREKSNSDSGSDSEGKNKKKKKKKKKEKESSDCEESEKDKIDDREGSEEEDESANKEESTTDSVKAPSLDLTEEANQETSEEIPIEKSENEESENKEEEKYPAQEDKTPREDRKPASEEDRQAEQVEKDDFLSEANTILVTASCDLTELASWRGEALEVESLLTEAGVIEESTVRNIYSTPPPLLITKHNEEFILREETFSPVRSTLLGSRDTSRDGSRDLKRGSSPCKTVFFEEQDEVPVISEPQNIEAVFRAPDHIARLHEKFASLQAEREVILSHQNIHSNGDNLSISELSGSPWTYAESTS